MDQRKRFVLKALDPSPPPTEYSGKMENIGPSHGLGDVRRIASVVAVVSR